MPLPLIPILLLGLLGAGAAAVAASSKPQPAPTGPQPIPPGGPGGMASYTTPGVTPGQVQVVPPSIPGINVPAQLPTAQNPYPNLPASVSTSLQQQLALQRDPAQLRLLAAQARQTAAQCTAAGRFAEAADYMRAATALEARANQLQNQAAPPGQAADPVAQAATVLNAIPAAMQQAAATAIADMLPPGTAPAPPATAPAPPAPSQPVPNVSPTVPFFPQPASMPQVPVPFVIPPQGVNMGASQRYQVASGDIASAIAARFGTTLSAFSKANPSQKNWNLIYPNQIFQVPSGAIDSGPRKQATGKTLDSMPGAAPAAMPASMPQGQPSIIPALYSLLPTQAPVQAQPGHYKVASGDIASAIAARFGTTLSAFSKANPSQKNWNLIYPNQVYALPPGATDSGPRKQATGQAMP